MTSLLSVRFPSFHNSSWVSQSHKFYSNTNIKEGSIEQYTVLWKHRWVTVPAVGYHTYGTFLLSSLSPSQTTLRPAVGWYKAQFLHDYSVLARQGCWLKVHLAAGFASKVMDTSVLWMRIPVGSQASRDPRCLELWGLPTKTIQTNLWQT